MGTKLGIVDAAAYVPCLRLQREAIFAANAWANPALQALARGTRSMCNWDEDSITMGVEAARRCMSGRARENVRRLYFASTTPPFAERQSATVAGEALNLSEKLAALDLGNSRNAGLQALCEAAGGSRQTLVVAADARRAKPASVQELQYGHGAAAMLLGNENLIAEVLGEFRLSRDFVDQFRGSGEAFDYRWEERWVRDRGYRSVLPALVRGVLKQSRVAPGQLARAVLPAAPPRMTAAFAKGLGLPAEAVQDGRLGDVGDTGAPHPLLLTIDALAQAAPGELILVVGFGQGGAALLLRATEELPAWQQRNAQRAALSPPRPESAYTKYLSFSGLLPMDFGMRAEADVKTQLSSFDRHRSELTGFVGGRCPRCNTVQFPSSRRCVNPQCNAEGEQEAVLLADEPGEVSSFTQDWLAYTPHPPLQYGLAAIGEGARVLMEFTECPLERMRVGLKLRFVFRIHAIDSQRGYRRYFWKGAPASAEEADG
ncbi:hypothetical protein [Candidatus Foliamicus sp.]